MSFSVMSLLTAFLELSFTGSFILARVRQVGDSLRQRQLASLAMIILLDLLLGLLCSYLLSPLLLPPRRSAEALMLTMKAVVSRLRLLITWLMGAPAGLKLNSVLSGALGKFFLYHIHLWVTFLELTAPHVTLALSLIADALKYVGFCLQVCLAQDTFNLISFHVHCFYAYARRLFRSQTSGLQSLWRLFRGKKYNPLRQRVDSCAGNDVDQLFVGTVAFTILLFLYPTTLMYYAVFAPLQLAVVAANYCLCATVRTVSRIQSYKGKTSTIL